MAEHTSLAAALAAFQAVVPKMSKDEKAKVKGQTQDGRPYDRSYDFAGLDQFVEIVEPVLGQHGLSVTSHPTWMPDGRFVLQVSLLHESGEERIGYWPLPDPYGRGVGPQDIGSAMTYGRRYVGWGLTGTFPGGADDDGKQAQESARERWEDARPVQPQAPAEPAKPAKTVWTDDDVRGFVGKIGELELDKSLRMYDWMASKDLHNRTVVTEHYGDMTATLALAGRLAAEALAADATMAEIKALQSIAADRGILKAQVSDTETLAEALFAAQELAQHATEAQELAEGTPGSAGSSND